MKQCPKGHRYPDKLPECPVCAKDSELQTVFAYRSELIPDAEKIESSSALSAEDKTSVMVKKEITPPVSEKRTDSNIHKTVILDRKHLLKKKAVLVGWLIELDAEDIPVKSYEIYDKKISIGRYPDNDIVINDDAVSGFHCSADFQNNKILITDEGSANGTIVDEKEISSQILDEKNIILLGRSKFKIQYLH